MSSYVKATQNSFQLVFAGIAGHTQSRFVTELAEHRFLVMQISILTMINDWLMNLVTHTPKTELKL
jgi:hypothetical protein